MKPIRALPFLVAFAFAGMEPAHARSELIAEVGRAAAAKDIDVVRLHYRRQLASDQRWWWPTHVQLGAGIWRVPDLAGTTQRFDANATSVWRASSARSYVEAGFGVYLLSHTVNNDTTSLPTSLQFGSHVGAGLRIGASGEAATLGIALQHLSNAGIKQPNGGVNFVLVTLRFPL